MLQEDSARIRVQTAAGGNAGYQFKTHPNIDKGAYSSGGLLGLKDPARPFPTGSALGILKWRLQARRARSHALPAASRKPLLKPGPQAWPGGGVVWRLCKLLWNFRGRVV